MGACGCGDISPYEIIKITEDKFIVFEKYYGCNYCASTIGVSLHFYDKKGFDTFLNGLDIKDARFDEFGGDSKHYLIFDIDEDLIPEMIKEEKNGMIGAYSQVENYLDDNGLDVIQRAMRSASKRDK